MSAPEKFNFPATAGPRYGGAEWFGGLFQVDVFTREDISMGNYWTATDDILGSSGAPPCPHCGQPMVPADDHGRFICFCQGISEGVRNNTFDAVSGTMLPTPLPIPQVDTAGITDAEKDKIPPINRLHAQATTAESRLLELMLKGPDAMNRPEYAAACRAVDEERRGKTHKA